ncbi:MAG: hypothetical protein ACTHKS_15195 [Gaiellaceae bacterium]
MGPLESYLDKVRTRAYTITDADVQAVKDAGVSEDEIFERTVAVAVEEGRRRLAAAERVITGVGSTEPARSGGADMRGAGAGK